MKPPKIQKIPKLYCKNEIFDLNLYVRQKIRNCGKRQEDLLMKDVAEFLGMKKRSIEQSFYYGRKMKIEELLKIIHIISFNINESPQDILDECLENCEYWRNINKEYIEKQKAKKLKTGFTK